MVQPTMVNYGCRSFGRAFPLLLKRASLTRKNVLQKLQLCRFAANYL